MIIHTSNRLETLLDALAASIVKPLPPLEQEQILVQSHGMGRWLSINLAQKFGIWANAQYRFPREMVQRLYRTCLPGLPDTAAFEPAVLQWRIMRLLPTVLEQAAFQPLQQYLGAEMEPLKVWQLAWRIADMLDQYQVYRPDWIRQWETDAASYTHWQACLWRLLIADSNNAENNGKLHHQVDIQQQVLAHLRQKQKIFGLPRRLSIFGISALPPFYLELFAALSPHCEVSLFLLSPSPSWHPSRQQHPLAHSMGKLNQDFLQLLETQQPRLQAHFQPGSGKNLLLALQNTMLAGQDSGRHPRSVALDDHSLQIHNCHSPLREIEVLHDHLLQLFEADPELKPSDILVMTPDIDAYAPLVQAVFNSHNKRYIPSTIADRSQQHDSQVITPFFKLLALSRERLPKSAVLSLLEYDSILQKFELHQTDQDMLSLWLERSGVRWGEDETSRTQLDLPEFRENSWQFGLDRLLLGYSMSSADEVLYQGIAPLAQVEGNDSVVLGKLLDFLKALFSRLQDLKQSHTPAQWADLLQQIMLEFFQATDNTQREMHHIRAALYRFQQETETAQFQKKQPLSVVEHWLQQAVQQNAISPGFLSGKLTFSALLPMRSIPFKVIALLGMNDRSWPRSHKTLGFDRIAVQPRTGDRSRRQDDRYLFLETLLSARQSLYISYVGQNIQDNSLQPPSVLVSELLNYLDLHFVMANGIACKTWLTRQHALQAYSPCYFNPELDRLSYAQEYLAASRLLQSAPVAKSPFIRKPLPEPDSALRSLSLKQLQSFFRNPSRWLLQERLKLQLDPDMAASEDNEALHLSGLEAFSLKNWLLKQQLDDQSTSDSYPLVLAHGQLPPGAVGAYRYQQTADEIEQFAAQVRMASAATPLEGLEFQYISENRQISGQLQGIYPKYLLRYQVSKCDANKLLRYWLEHLLLNAIAPEDYPRESHLLFQNENILFKPVDDARDQLAQLLDLYWSGLQSPLPFFPKSSYAFAQKIHQGKSVEDARRAARTQWEGNLQWPGEQDVWSQRCFGHGEALNEAFESIAEQVFLPLLVHQH